MLIEANLHRDRIMNTNQIYLHQGQECKEESTSIEKIAERITPKA